MVFRPRIRKSAVLAAEVSCLELSHKLPPACRPSSRHFSLFRGHIEEVKVDLMVVEGDRDPRLKGFEGKRLVEYAGQALQEASIRRGEHPAGDLRVTPGFGLPCRELAQAVHTLGLHLESLGLCYDRAMAYARSRNYRSVSFSLLGGGLTIRCPELEAARVAVEKITGWLAGPLAGSVKRVILCVHGTKNLTAADTAIREWAGSLAGAGATRGVVRRVSEGGYEVGGEAPRLPVETVERLVKAAQEGEAEPLCWDRPYPSDPELGDEWGRRDWARVLYFQELAHSPQFGRFWEHLELELGKVIPELELVAGDGDCLYSAVAKYLSEWGEEPALAEAMRRVVSTALLEGEPMSYVNWGILSDKESPALSVEAYALALLEPRKVFGGQLELQILSEWLGFRYYVFVVPSGLTVYNERTLPGGITVDGPPLVLLFHSKRQHFDLINPIKRARGGGGDAGTAPCRGAPAGAPAG
jgi:hypothetical protein